MIHQKVRELDDLGLVRDPAHSVREFSFDECQINSDRCNDRQEYLWPLDCFIHNHPRTTCGKLERIRWTEHQQLCQSLACRATRGCVMPQSATKNGWLGGVIERSKKAADSGPKPMKSGQVRHISQSSDRRSVGTSSGSESCHVG